MREKVKGPNLHWLRAMLLLAFGMLAAEASASESAQRCAAFGDDRARLACYDELFRNPDAPAAATPAIASAATATVAAVPTPEADFGLTETAKRARDPEKAAAELPASITGTVAAVGRRPAGELIVTLENGQVWTQVLLDQRARVAVGDSVIIRKAALGSHQLVTAGRYATTVRRVK